MPGWHLPPIVIHRRFSAAELGEQLGYWITDYGLDTLPHKGGEGVTVGICDTGIATLHRTEAGDLHDAVIAARDFTGSRNDAEDLHGHGTHVAGIVAARHQNGRGIAGVAPKAKLVIAKVLGDSGSGSDESVASGIRYCVDSGSQVINCSLGGGGRSRLISAAIDYAASRNCIVVCAAGNEGGRVGYPAADANNICVGAIDARKVLASFSNRGNEIDVVAPGVEILSTYARGGYAMLSGTSMATPWVSGLLALLIGEHNGAIDLAVAKVRELLGRASIDLGPTGKDPGYGWGVPDPAKVLVATEPPKPTPPVSGQLVRFEGVLETIG